MSKKKDKKSGKKGVTKPNTTVMNTSAEPVDDYIAEREKRFDVEREAEFLESERERLSLGLSEQEYRRYAGAGSGQDEALEQIYAIRAEKKAKEEDFMKHPDRYRMNGNGDLELKDEYENAQPDEADDAEDETDDGVSALEGVRRLIWKAKNGKKDNADTLRPTKSGQKQISTFRQSKKRPKSELDAIPSEDKYRLRNDMVHSIDDILADAVSNINAGKMGKAYDERDVKAIELFVEAFESAQRDDDLMYLMVTRIRTLISIGKSYYEYDDKQRSYISNNLYDGIVAKFLALGKVEPNGIVPKGSKNASKTKIKYPELHNNMDKAYVVYVDDPIPAGVKEKTSVEAFLLKIYKELGITSETSIELELSPKLDGVSVNGTIIDETLNTPQTRGDDTESVSIMGMNGMCVGDKMTDMPSFGIQYECFVTEEDRLAVSEYLGLENPYVSCRHAAAGIVQRLSTMDDDNLLTYVSMYPIATVNLDGTYTERMDFIQNYGVVPKDMIERKVIKGDMNKLLKAIRKEFNSLDEVRADLSYAIDGMIITVVDEDYQDMIGREGRTNKYQVAIKFDPASAQATVAGITLDSGMKGFRTIQVELEEPIYLDGVRYGHVPVLSAGLYDELELRVGSTVNVHRVGDVIPSITVIKAGAGAIIELPKECPDCGALLKTKAKKLYCDCPTCNGNVAGRIHNMISGLDINGYSIEFAKTLANHGIANNLADLFNATKAKFEEAGLTGKKYANFSKTLKAAIANKRDFEILAIMGIPEVGSARAKELLSEVGGFKSLIGISWEEADRVVEAVKGFSDTLSISDFIRSNLFQTELVAISKYIDAFTEDFDSIVRVGHTGGDLSKESKDLCRKLGFEITEGKRCDILIVPNMKHTSAKTERAVKKGAQIMTDDDFIEKYKN